MAKENNDNKKKIDTLIANIKSLNNKKNIIEKNLNLCTQDFDKITKENATLHNDLRKAMNEIREYQKKLSEYKK